MTSLRRFPQQGFAAIAAIFLVVVLAALGTFMVTFSNTQQVTATQDVQGSRAYWAARGGLEWAVVALQTNPAVLCPSAAPTTMTGGPVAIDGFTLTISCAFNSYIEDGATRSIYRFESRAATAGSVGSLTYVERSVSASLELPLP